MICTVALMRHGGSHLIRPIVAKLGGEIVEPGNFGASLDQAQGPVIVFLRDPRDRMTATHRWWLQKPRKARLMGNAGAGVDAQLAWLLDDAGFMTEMLRWARIWCSWPDALTVRFEAVREFGVSEIGRIAAHLGLCRDYQRDAQVYAEVFEKGRTFTGKYSDWRESFGPQANAVWAEKGGAELLQLMGYG